MATAIITAMATVMAMVILTATVITKKTKRIRISWIISGEFSSDQKNLPDFHIMKVQTLPIEGLLLIEPDVFYDERGYFLESFNEDRFTAAGITARFVQDNHSVSNRGVLRGLHYQRPPHDQGKLVRVVKGAVTDVVVDIRKSSSTYGKYISVSLTEENRQMLWIPPGFAHGFLALKDDTIFLYKCSKVYNKISENGILWNDPDLGIDWKWDQPLVSAKDRELESFRNLVSEF